MSEEKQSIGNVAEGLDAAIKAIDEHNRYQEEIRKKAIELKHKEAIQEQEAIVTARVLSGRVQKDPESDEVLETPVDPNKEKIEKNRSIAVQSTTGLVTSLFSIFWITYLGTDVPPELLAAVAALVPILGQGVATAINNKGAK